MNYANHPAAVVAHLQPQIWYRVNRLLVRKALAEFSHEQLMTPKALGPADRPGWQHHQVQADNQNCVYRFDAKPMALRHWWIDPDSIVRLVDGQQQGELDALVLINDFKQSLAIPAEKLPVYLDEINSTLFSAAYKATKTHLTSEQLADADYQRLESAMTEGHPCFVANNGRIGFDADDYFAYAPETGSQFALVWLAVRKDHAHYAAIPGLDHEQLYQQELGSAQLMGWRARLGELGVNADDYLFMPTHPWQWYNKLSMLFAADIANRRIVPLGESTDLYAPQQSIRTYFNVSTPNRRYVKTALSILNMGFMRGLSPYYMAGTPAINAYLYDRLSVDPVLAKLGFTLLREVATIGYHNRYYEAALGEINGAPKKMLSTLWRESPTPYLQEGQRLMTMAALLHIDPEGQPLLPVLIQRSGLGPKAWLRQYLRAFLQPLVHCFYAHKLAFMPHCENLILVLEDHVPIRAFMKDIGEEAAILDKHAKLPKDLERLAIEVPEDQMLLCIQVDIFDGVFRHMGQILEQGNCLSEQQFWRCVADAVIDYQQAHPELAERFAQYDLFAPQFLHACLNRLQLKNNLQMVNLADPATSMITVDPLDNPLAPFRPSDS